MARDKIIKIKDTVEVQIAEGKLKDKTGKNYITDGQAQDLIQKVIPNVTTADNGKFLRVVSGAWAVVTLNNAEGAEF